MSAKNRITINFRIGKNSGSKDASGNGAAVAITDAVAAETANFATERVRVGLKGLNSRLQRTIETEYALGIKYAADSLMGQLSNYGSDMSPKVFSFSDAKGSVINTRIGDTKRFKMATQPFSRGQVTWARLTGNTIRRKVAGGLSVDRARRFYRNTGRLRQELLTQARSMVKRTGVVKITMNNSGRFVSRARGSTIPVGQLRITLMPNVSRSSLPGLISGNLGDDNPSMSFERSLGMSSDAITKLQGPMAGSYNLSHRPLLQPVFTYWSLFRIPNKIASALNDSIVSATQGGVEDYSAGSN
ncbi:MAG: hypothetical protein EOQ39_18770 [Mesorhizobium sp.]|uniref:hypothetical protein n=1 Tax=Mesorhizobium sp. TaxID=1871066 RepID=UPI000FE7B0FC|nr:hypothetical protein [Mesorhizobium sp.]RWB08785.1 MAG: hypothetical protein EOQ37_04570 [Mesorhizobium sp.]RWB13564.1 MAG: hypothetical protein EOQ39_18770 [Mesorhizobium sp.]